MKKPLALFLLTVMLTLGAGTSSASAFNIFQIFRQLPSIIQVIQLSNLSDQDEIKIGAQINKQIVNQVNISENEPLTEYIDTLGQDLAKHSSRPELDYTFQVVEDDSVNAFATMGGFVYVHTGLIEEAENEAELASVIGHEIGHITGRHAIKQMRQQGINQIALEAIGVADEQIVQIGVALALDLPHSRKDEIAADTSGLNMIKAAGYAPDGMISFMKKLGSGGGPEFMSTHPHSTSRVENLENQVNNETRSQGKGLDNSSYKKQINNLM
jgi:predicted Zn-dependent protease